MQIRTADGQVVQLDAQRLREDCFVRGFREAWPPHRLRMEVCRVEQHGQCPGERVVEAVVPIGEILRYDAVAS